MSYILVFLYDELIFKLVEVGSKQFTVSNSSTKSAY